MFKTVKMIISIANLEVELASIAERFARCIAPPQGGLLCPTLATHFGRLCCPELQRLFGWKVWSRALGHKKSMGVLVHSGSSTEY